MFAIEGIGVEVIYTGIAIFLSIIAFTAWASTRVTNFREVERERSETGSQNRNLVSESHEDVYRDQRHSDNGIENVRSEDAHLQVCNSPLPVQENSSSSCQQVFTPSNEEQILQNNTISITNSRTQEFQNEQSMNSHFPVEQTGSNSNKLQRIKVRIKFLNDSLKVVDGFLEESLKDFKRRHFSSDLAMNRCVRLIFQGQLLRDENRSLKQHGLCEGCIVHCQIVTLPTNSSNSNSLLRPHVVHELEFDLGGLLLPLFLLLLLGLWYAWLQLFEQITIGYTIALILMTVLLITFALALHVPLRRRNQI